MGLKAGCSLAPCRCRTPEPPGRFSSTPRTWKSPPKLSRSPHKFSKMDHDGMLRFLGRRSGVWGWGGPSPKFVCDTRRWRPSKRSIAWGLAIFVCNFRAPPGGMLGFWSFLPSKTRALHRGRHQFREQKIVVLDSMEAKWGSNPSTLEALETQHSVGISYFCLQF